jgi:hypothetical protein
MGRAQARARLNYAPHLQYEPGIRVPQWSISRARCGVCVHEKSQISSVVLAQHGRRQHQVDRKTPSPQLLLVVWPFRFVSFRLLLSFLAPLVTSNEFEYSHGWVGRYFPSVHQSHLSAGRGPFRGRHEEVPCGGGGQ